jgi:hypothetical protein
MLLNCANPNCSAEFLYLYDGELFVIELPNRTVERYWLCRECALSMRVAYVAPEGVSVMQRKNVMNSGDSRKDHGSHSTAA